MSNILPRDAQRAVNAMFRARAILAGSLLAIAIAALCALTLLPSYLALHTGEGSGVASSTIPKAVNTEDREAIARVRSALAALSPVVSATTTPLTAIEHALSLRPSTISITRISYTAGKQGTLMLVGSAATREAISGYRQALAADPLFKTASIPVSDLTGAPGAQFSLTLTGNF